MDDHTATGRRFFTVEDDKVGVAKFCTDNFRFVAAGGFVAEKKSDDGVFFEVDCRKRRRVGRGISVS